MKRSKKLTIALTGATGLVGRNFLFECIQQNLDRLGNLTIFILGRNGNHISLRERIRTILFEDGINYISSNPEDLIKIKRFFDSRLIFVPFELEASEAELDKTVFPMLDVQIDEFYHFAASTDFRDSEAVIATLERVNIQGTELVMKMLGRLDVGCINFISTSYACGKTYGKVSPKITNLDQEFRNPYEKSKLEAEQIVISYANQFGMKYRILRPSTVSGRLIENEIGAIPKFNVFYGWALFFLKYKMKKLDLSLTEALNKRTHMDMRIYTHPDAGLNIIPADFIAKTIYGISKSKTSDIYFHLTNEYETAHETYMSILLEGLNISGYTFVSEQPKNPNTLESLYYKTVGKIFHGYVTQPEISFDTNNLNKIYKKNKLKCPTVDKDAMLKLTAYAISKNFGIASRTVLA